MKEDDPLLHALRSLPAREPSAHVRERVRRRARAELHAPELADWVRNAWSRAVVPALVATFAVAYLGWAFHVATMLRS